MVNKSTKSQNGKGSAAKTEVATEEKKKAISRAVLVTDSFIDEFTPVTDDCSVGQIPLVNSKLIFYSCDRLMLHEVKEVYVYCTLRNLDNIKKECKQWTDYSWGTPDYQIYHVRALSEKINLGEIMRDIYELNVMDSDFLLLTGNVVTGMDFEKLMAEHKEAVQKDEKIVLSQIFTGRKDFIDSDSDLFVDVDFQTDTKQLLRQRKANEPYPIDEKLVAKYGSIRALRNYVNSHVSVCTKTLPSLFADNMDYETMKNLIEGILAHEDTEGYKVRSVFCRAEFASPIRSFDELIRVSCAVVNRNILPIEPEFSPATGNYRYTHKYPENIYSAASATFSFTEEHKGENVVLDAGTSVSSKTTIRHTTVGKHCQIGKNCKIIDSIILDNVTILDNCNIIRSYIGCGSKILSDVELESGVILNDNVIIGPSVKIQSNKRYRAPSNGETTDVNVGSQGHAVLVEFSEIDCGPLFADDLIEEDSSDEDDIDCLRFLTSSDEDMLDEEDITPEKTQRRKYENSIDEITKNIHSRFGTGCDVMDLGSEISGIRHAYNIPLEVVIYAVAKAAISMSRKKEPQLLGAALLSDTSKNVNYFWPLLSKYAVKKPHKMAVLDAIEDCVAEESFSVKLVPKIVHTLYERVNKDDESVLDEESILAWYEKTEESSETKIELTELIEWLKEDDPDDE